MEDDQAATAVDQIANLMDDGGNFVEKPEAQEGDGDKPEGQDDGEANPQPQPEATQPETSEPEKPTYSLKLRGQEVKKSLDEIIAMAQQGEDYTFKTQRLADERKAWEAKESQITQERELYKQAALKMAPQKPDLELLKTDPMEYMLRERLHNDWLQQETARQQKEFADLQAKLAQEQEQLLAKLPEWRDAKVRSEEVSKIHEVLQSAQVTPEQFQVFNTNHNLTLLARELVALREYKAQREDAEKLAVKKVEKLPPKVERPGVAAGAERGASRDLQARARRTGKAEDAAAAIAALL